MSTETLIQGMLAVAILAVAACGCGTTESDDGGGSEPPVEGTGGLQDDAASARVSGSGGSVGQGPRAVGGSSNLAGATVTASGGGTPQGEGAIAPAALGGTRENGGGPALGGSAGVAGQASASFGGGGPVGGGEPVGSGGIAGSAGLTRGGGLPAEGGDDAVGGGPGSGGGSTAAGGLGEGGGHAEPATGGSGQSGGTTAAEGVAGGIAQAGHGTGGNPNTGGANGVGGQDGGETRIVSFGTLLEPQAVVAESQQLAQTMINPSDPQWQATGDQHRSYRFDAANADEPYRIYVPTDWDGQSKLALMMFLHGAGSNENTYLDQNGSQMVSLAQEYGFLLVSPLGAQGAYGNFLRLSAPFGNEPGAADLMAQVTAESERTNELSEMDVINVLELVLAEYPVDREAMFLAGHSMGSGGTWYIGGKYSEYWRAVAPMSGPFVQESGYPWEDVRSTAIFVTEGTQAPSLDASRLLRDWLLGNDFNAEYEEVNADHGGMIPLALPEVFAFFRRAQGS